VILFTDVETTGIHPSNLLLEVAAIITDDDLNPIDEFHRVIGWDHVVLMDFRNDADSHVQEMHDKTGLWDKVLVSKTDCWTVDEDFLAFITRHAPEPRTIMLAGNSVRLDANFIDEWLPSVSEHVHYRILDVSSIAFEASVRGIPPFPKKYRHEAMSDIRETIDELRYLRANLYAPVTKEEQE